MTHPSGQHPSEQSVFDEERLGGHTLDELSDYLEAGRTPADPSIDQSPECQLALTDLERLRAVSASLIERDADESPQPDDSWIGTILANIGREVRAGREIPLENANPTVTLTVTEGSVRSLIRAAGDVVDGVLIGRCRLDGDVTVLGEPITVSVWVTALEATGLTGLAQRVRDEIQATLNIHTDLVIAGIDVTVQDLQLRSIADEGGDT